MNFLTRLRFGNTFCYYFMSARLIEAFLDLTLSTSDDNTFPEKYSRLFILNLAQ